MRVLKGTGHYLEKQAKIYKSISYIFLIIAVIGLLYSLKSLKSWLIIVILAFILQIQGIFFSKYKHYSDGLESEKTVTQHLQNLDDRYYLINDIKLPTTYGNIDHIILGPNGIFVIETKSFEGLIKCNKDRWYQYKPEWKIPIEYPRKSPSRHVKVNALRLKELIESKHIFNNPLKIWINGIVVFTNERAQLKLINPTVIVLKIQELIRYIKNKKSKLTFSSKELESIGKAILDYAQTD